MGKGEWEWRMEICLEVRGILLGDLKTDGPQLAPENISCPSSPLASWIYNFWNSSPEWCIAKWNGEWRMEAANANGERRNRITNGDFALVGSCIGTA